MNTRWDGFSSTATFSCLSRCAAALMTSGRPPPVVLTLFSSRPAVLPRAPHFRAHALRRPFVPLPLCLLIEWGEGEQILNFRLCCRCHRKCSPRLTRSFVTFLHSTVLSYKRNKNLIIRNEKWQFRILQRIGIKWYVSGKCAAARKFEINYFVSVEYCIV